MKIIERECCIAVNDYSTRKAIISALSVNGFRTVGDAIDCCRFLRTLRKVQPHLAVMSINLPGNGLETATIIDQEYLAAVLIVSEIGVSGTSVFRDHNFTVMFLPADITALAAVAEVLCLEFIRRKKIFEENRSLKDKLRSRIIMERAKGCIMEEFSIAENQAYRLLQKKSMELRVPIENVAEEILKKKGLLNNSGV